MSVYENIEKSKFPLNKFHYKKLLMTSIDHLMIYSNLIIIYYALTGCELPAI